MFRRLGGCFGLIYYFNKISHNFSTLESPVFSPLLLMFHYLKCVRYYYESAVLASRAVEKGQLKNTIAASKQCTDESSWVSNQHTPQWKARRINYQILMKTSKHTDPTSNANQPGDAAPVHNLTEHTMSSTILAMQHHNCRRIQ